MTEIEWTTTPPAEPGWYWARWDEHSRPQCFHVFAGERGLVCAMPGHGGTPYVKDVVAEWWPVPIEEPPR